MAKKNLLLAIILALLFAFIVSIGLDGTKSHNLTARSNVDHLEGRAGGLLATSLSLVVPFRQ